MAEAHNFVRGLLGSAIAVGVALALTACGSSGGTVAPVQTAAPITAATAASATTTTEPSADASETAGAGGALTNLTSALSAASSLAAGSKNEQAAPTDAGAEENCPLNAADISTATAMNR